MTAHPTLLDGVLVAVGDRVPGITVAIVGPEGVREVASAGFADLAAGVEASAEMACPWFSMTKIVTATAAMRLTERNVLDLDAPVLPLVPALRTLEPAP